MLRAAFDDFLSAAAACAGAMLSNAEYILRELPSLEVTDAQRAAIGALCESFIGTKHDVFSEVSEMSQRRGEAGSPGARAAVRRILGWLREDLPRLDDVVQSLDPGGRLGDHSAAHVLLAESGGNVLHAFVRAKNAADAYFAAAGSSDSPAERDATEPAGTCPFRPRRSDR
jgi:hypothetical protein